jgi:hypothetical protein
MILERSLGSLLFEDGQVLRDTGKLFGIEPIVAHGRINSCGTFRTVIIHRRG